MASGDAHTVDSFERPFQFTLRQLLVLITVCSFGLALVFHWGFVGFIVCYAAACVIAMSIGAYRWKSDLFLAGFTMFAFGFCVVPGLFPCCPRGSARRASCQNNLHNIALALQQYHETFGCFPPPYIADADGKPMHSWRVLLLPYLDQRNLYKQYRFDEPWDGPNNSKLHGTVLKIYCCPAHSGKTPTTDTSYTVVVGPKTVWPDQNKNPIRMVDMIDGSSNTILVVEVANSGIHWMEPRDLHISQMPMAINPPRGQGISSEHKGGANAAFVDGSVRFLPNDTPPATLRAALTRNGKEPPNIP